MKKRGRPEKYDDRFYRVILKEHEVYSLKELAKFHNVARSTIINWIARGRKITNEQAES